MNRLAAIIIAGSISTGVMADEMIMNKEGESKADRMTSDTASLQERFDKLDADGDGAISEAEAKENPAIDEQFSQLDVDGDGSISSNEMMVNSGDSTAAGMQNNTDSPEEELEEGGMDDGGMDSQGGMTGEMDTPETDTQ